MWNVTPLAPDWASPASEAIRAWADDMPLGLRGVPFAWFQEHETLVLAAGAHEAREPAICCLTCLLLPIEMELPSQILLHNFTGSLP
jgi:hypothetical protein